MAGANRINIPFHLTLSSKDRVVSPIKNREFFDKVSSTEKMKFEYEVGHEILANKDIKDQVIDQ